MEIARLHDRLKAEGRLNLPVRIVPRSPRTEWAGFLESGDWKIRVAAPPERGKANEELIRFLAAEFGVPRDAIEIVAGATSHNKLIRIQPRR
ncbi:MAG: DUF167 domain-containing protein [Bryobacteraceae bacterium]